MLVEFGVGYGGGACAAPPVHGVDRIALLTASGLTTVLDTSGPSGDGSLAAY